MPYTTQDNIISKNLYRDSLHLNLVGFYILAEDFPPYILKNWLQIETQKQRKSIEVSSSENTTEDSHLKALRMKYPENPIIALININSVRNKFKTLVSLVNSDLDILIILETLNHELFPHLKFMIGGFLLPYCLDRNAHGGGFYCVSEVILLKCYSTIRYWSYFYWNEYQM